MHSRGPTGGGLHHTPSTLSRHRAPAPSLPFPPKQIKKGPCGKQQRSTKRGKKALLPFLFFSFIFILFCFTREFHSQFMDGLGKVCPSRLLAPPPTFWETIMLRICLARLIPNLCIIWFECCWLQSNYCLYTPFQFCCQPTISNFDNAHIKKNWTDIYKHQKMVSSYSPMSMSWHCIYFTLYIC